MSVWQFTAAVEGWHRANSPDAAGELTADEEDDLWQWLKK